MPERRIIIITCVIYIYIYIYIYICIYIYMYIYIKQTLHIYFINNTDELISSHLLSTLVEHFCGGSIAWMLMETRLASVQLIITIFTYNFYL